MKIQFFVVAIACCLCAGVEAADPNDPTAKVEALMKRLVSGKSEKAFVDFFAGSLVAEQKEQQVRVMDSQFKPVLEVYGSPIEYELVETSKMGKSLVRIKWISKHKNEVPLFWNGLFYRRNGKWEPLDVAFVDSASKAGF